jgi:hypothetical protein
MKRVHLVHIIPNDKLHIFHGYDEIIETIQWGLAQLGCEVTYAINQFEPRSMNIVFGAQMLGVEHLKRIPANSIIYNLEQATGLKPESLRDSYRYCAEHLQIWDYSELNLPTWERFASAKRPLHVPIGYAPILSRIPKPEKQEIDVLFYGGPGGERLRIFHDLCSKLVRTVFVHGLYGKSRDDLISKSKIVLNINQYPAFGVFEIARASYLLANSKAIVSDVSSTSKIESDIRDAIRFCALEQVVSQCLDLLDDDATRIRLENDGFKAISKRDIRMILQNTAITL